MTIPQQRAAILLMIRASMFAGVTLFGAVIWALHHQGSWNALDVPPAMRMLPPIVLAAAVLAVLLIRLVWSTRPAATDRTPLAVIGWGIAEAPALAGGVYYFFTDDPRWMLGGAFVLLASFLLLPVRAPD